jgi:hypothetical protein
VRRKDAPERDPHVSELGGFDVCALAPAELSREGITTGHGVIVAETGTHPFWKSHSEFLADVRPDWDVQDRSYARSDAAHHVSRVLAAAAVMESKGEDAGALRSRPLEGLRLARSFPCLGALRVVESVGRVRIVQCDGCGETFGVAEPKAEGGKARAEGPVKAYATNAAGF